MKKLFFLCLILVAVSCSKDDASTTQEEINLQISHYKTTSLLYGTALIGQEDDALQAMEIPYISGFDFQQGNTYDLLARKNTIKNSGTNATTVSYELIAIQTQDTIPPNTTFRMPLAEYVNGFGYVRFVVGSPELGYTLSHEIPIDCQEFCGELRSKLVIEDPIMAEFRHGLDGGYVLVGLN